jgi:signal transduction histidine kinase
MSFLDLVARDDEFAARMAIAGAANGVPQAERESRWLTREGDERTVAWTATPITDPSGRARVLLSGADVTERKRQEAEVRASRSRIVAATDAARRRLERNLHDGAQQRLAALSLSLRLAESRLPADPEKAVEILAGARAELTQALEELRELARGLHPNVLTDRGLGPALESLVIRSPIPVEIDVPDERFPPAVEAAAYYVAAEALANVAKSHCRCSSSSRCLRSVMSIPPATIRTTSPFWSTSGAVCQAMTRSSPSAFVNTFS